MSFWCEEADSDGANTITRIISFVVSVFTIGVGVLGTIGMIWSSIIIMSAHDNTPQVQRAKRRIIEVIIGMAMWILAVMIIALLLPSSNATEVLTGAGLLN